MSTRDPSRRSGPVSAPFSFARALAARANCHLAVPSGRGIGDVLVFTPLVEAFARSAGHRIRLLTAPLAPKVGVVSGEVDYPIWLNNPFVSEIRDARPYGKEAIDELDDEKDSCCQFNHVIENICVAYDLRPRKIRPSLFLTSEEQAWALDKLRMHRRPLIAVHPGGKSSSLPPSPWHEHNWRELIRRCSDVAGFLHVGKHDFDQRRLGIPAPTTTLRQLFALIWACDAFIGFDSAPMHVAAAFERPSLIVWDAERKFEEEEHWQRGFSPAVMLRWGYPNNRNLMILGEHSPELLDQAELWLRALISRLA